MTKKSSAISLRLSEENCEKFKKMAQDKDLSQSELLVSLMEQASVQQPLTSNQEEGKCVIYLCRDNYFVSDEELQHKDIKKLEFKGKALYYPQTMYVLDVKRCGDALKKEFSIEEPLDSYRQGYVLNLFQEDVTKRYIVNEVFHITKEDAVAKIQKDMLYVSRCKIVSDYHDIEKKFSTYADPRNLRAIQFSMAEPIILATQFLEDYFK